MTDFWIGTSWKMNKTLAEAREFATALAAADADRDPRIQRFVIPPFTACREVGADPVGAPASRSAPRTCTGPTRAPGPERSAPPC